MTVHDAELIVKSLWSRQDGTISQRIVQALLEAYNQGAEDEGRAWHHSEVCGFVCSCDKAFPPKGEGASNGLTG